MSVFEVIEGSTATYSATLTDETGTALNLSDMTTITFTLYNTEVAAGSIINSRSAVSVLNTNGGTFADGGLFSLTLTKLDNVVLESWRSREVHRAMIDFTWASGTKRGSHEFSIVVINRPKIGVGLFSSVSPSPSPSPSPSVSPSI